MNRDYYIVLGVNRGSDLNQIKKAYRTAAKKYHPDTSHSSKNSDKFLEASKAYDILSNEEKRLKYDMELEKHELRLRDLRRQKAFRSRLEEMESIFFSTADDFFEGSLFGFFDLEKGRPVEKDLFYEAILSPQEAARGGLFPITVPVTEPCSRCRRSGLWDGIFSCPACSGYGRVKSERGFSLSIPPNVIHGTEIRLSMEDIGLRNVYLNIIVTIDPLLEKGVLY